MGGDLESVLSSLVVHFAVWDDDISRLEAIIASGTAHLEALNRRGETPLLLAYRLGRLGCARVLLAAGAAPNARTPDGWEAFHIAALSNKTELVREAVMASLRETDAAFQRRGKRADAVLSAMPDFVLKLRWDLSSWVPLVGSLMPSDNVTISKRGSSIRVDTTLLGMNGLKWERGSVSLIVWGQDGPVPGGVRVLDNEDKTACDARLAFTHPRDTHIQDWVRKLLTARSKVSDWWSRDVFLAPQRRRTFGSALLGAVGLGGGGGKRVRGRRPPTDDSDDDDEASAPAPPAHDYNDTSCVTADVGSWTGCAAYDLTNLCVTDLTRGAIRKDLPLASWWKPEYSSQVDNEGAASYAAHAEKVEARKKAAAAAKAGSPAATEDNDTPTGDVATDAAPERFLKPIHLALSAVSLGAVNERNAKALSLADLKKLELNEGGAGDDNAVGGASVAVVSFEDFFGVPRPVATKDAASSATAATPQPDGRLHKLSAAVAGEPQSAGVSSSEKALDLKVFFSRDFPLTMEQFLPVADVMARTSRHAENFRRFFSTKMPSGAGFPVRFTVPVFPTITMTSTFESCTLESPPAELFVVPPDYKMGAYVEKGFIRQL